MSGPKDRGWVCVSGSRLDRRGASGYGGQVKKKLRQGRKEGLGKEGYGTLGEARQGKAGESNQIKERTDSLALNASKVAMWFCVCVSLPGFWGTKAGRDEVMGRVDVWV